MDLPELCDALIVGIEDGRARIRQFFESYGILIQEWDSVRTDWLTLRPTVKVPVKEKPATVAASV